MATFRPWPSLLWVGAGELLNEGEVHDQLLANPYIKPEMAKDKILKEVRSAKERAREEEVAPLDERLRALVAMVVHMSGKNGK